MGVDGCGNFGGSGDLWRDGAMSLSEEGLLRLARAFEHERDSRRTGIGTGAQRGAHA